ncbi:FAD-dependent oxidoreductase, partial [Klebsiella pneumoniae]|nr:FAD-dependent oxidoreductase [Klebsiella pneumoniae]
MRHFDLIIVGSGSGNSILDDRFSDWDVAIVDKGIGPTDSYGGTCLNVGCIPTKMFVHTADVASAPAAGAGLGVDLELQQVRWPDIRDRIFGRIDTISESGRRYRAEENPNVTLYTGLARFTGVKQLTVETADGPEEITADQIVVAAGGRPRIPDIPGLDDVTYHTSDTVMRLEELPRRMIIVGGGFIGAEFMHIFSSLGVE